MVKCKYDAWGKPIARRSLTTAYEALGKLNPFRYRGYVWDEETGLYYLRSRYYHPTSARFVNADTRLNARGFGSNPYSYCGGNPVIRADDGGFAWYNDVWDWTKNAASEAWNRTSNAIVDGWNWTTQAVSDAADWTSQAAMDAWNWSVNTASSAWNWITKAATAAWKWVSDAAVHAWNWIVTAAKNVATVARKVWTATKAFVVSRFSTPEKASNTLSGIGIVFEGITMKLGGKAPKAAIVTGIIGLAFHGAAWFIDVINEE